MASWTRRERTVTYVEYALDLPANWAEVSKIFAELNQELGERAEWDDAVEVTSDSAELVFRYVKEGP
ncbi:hypothetical protein DP939_02295 [Spongiactinospora rosea]|uniref:Uncharacterized protein n=1 Tax=Spongiactinospora rosea TaxID=2248750 RepID=A0A366M5T0_9ACTN|nr:hypothetical protein [Spongiactinospora rosea]RBQ21561.1 hypothetical protein DP939_02295 [Spongiactinospora rosea]